jgi:hypothetical protein
MILSASRAGSPSSREHPRSNSRRITAALHKLATLLASTMEVIGEVQTQPDDAPDHEEQD